MSIDILARHVAHSSASLSAALGQANLDTTSDATLDAALGVVNRAFPYYDPRRYIGGSNSHSTVFQAIANRLGAMGGGRILVIGTAWTLSSPLILPNTVRIEGIGREASVVSTTAAGSAIVSDSTTPSLNNPDRRYRIGGQNFTLNYTGATPSGTCGFDLVNETQAVIDHVSINGFATCVRAAGSSLYTFLDDIQCAPAAGGVSLSIEGGTRCFRASNFRVNGGAIGIKIAASATDWTNDHLFVGPILESSENNFVGVSFESVDAGHYTVGSTFLHPRFDASGNNCTAFKSTSNYTADITVVGPFFQFSGTGGVPFNFSDTTKVSILSSNYADYRSLARQIMLVDTNGSNQALVYADASNVYMRGPADSTNKNLYCGQVTANGQMSATGLMATNTYFKNSIPVAVGSLPAPGTAGAGARHFCNDLSGASYVFGSAASGGGSRKGPVFCDGSQWLEG